MIGRLRGLVIEVGEEEALIDVAGVGYVVRCGSRTLSHLPALGEETVLQVETQWTESAGMKLYGFLGRDEASQFVVLDPRVSRRHSKIEWRAGKYYLEDVSSYGTWVRFSDGPAVVALRRQECMLLQQGEIALGAPFEDFTVPTVSFEFLAEQAAQTG